MDCITEQYLYYPEYFVMIKTNKGILGQGIFQKHLTTGKWRTEEMKKLLSLLALALVCVLAMTMGASAQVNADVKVSAIAEVYTYHQIKAFVLEYPTEIAEPEEGTYTIVDFAPAHMKEDYDQRPYAEAVITAVYTNDAPEMREDKTSVPGKYVIIEQELVNGSYLAQPGRAV